MCAYGLRVRLPDACIQSNVHAKTHRRRKEMPLGTRWAGDWPEPPPTRSRCPPWTWTTRPSRCTPPPPIRATAPASRMTLRRHHDVGANVTVSFVRLSICMPRLSDACSHQMLILNSAKPHNQSIPELSSMSPSSAASFTLAIFFTLYPNVRRERARSEKLELESLLFSL